MSRRRSTYDPLQAAAVPAWLVVRDNCASLMAATQLAPGTVLRATLEKAERDWSAAGWLVEPRTPVCSTFFCTRGGERREVGIARRDPHGPQVDEGRISTPAWPVGDAEKRERE